MNKAGYITANLKPKLREADAVVSLFFIGDEHTFVIIL